jgi:putative ABC transport system permease protein
MTLSSFVVRNTFRNKRRSLLTMLSISFSLLLLTLMMSIWRTFYIDQGPPDSVKRIITRDRVSLAFFLPAYYRDKIRTVPGVLAVVPMTYFGNVYKDDRSTNSFAQVVTDPEEYPKVAADKIVPPDQLLAWQRDRTGAMVDVELANKFGWKIGDHLTLQSPYFPVHPEVTIRAIYTIDPPVRSLIFNTKYLEESVDWFKGQAGWYSPRSRHPVTSPPFPRQSMRCFAMLPNEPRPRASRRSNSLLYRLWEM